jgi:hypothetical protein
MVFSQLPCHMTDVSKPKLTQLHVKTKLLRIGTSCLVCTIHWCQKHDFPPHKTVIFSTIIASWYKVNMVVFVYVCISLGFMSVYYMGQSSKVRTRLFYNSCLGYLQCNTYIGPMILDRSDLQFETFRGSLVPIAIFLWQATLCLKLSFEPDKRPVPWVSNIFHQDWNLTNIARNIQGTKYSRTE